MTPVSTLEKNHFNTVVIGAGQAGLSTGYFLKRMNKDFVILDENEKIGDSWRKRWDSLRLFTPAQYDGLPGMPFPAAKDSFPSKDKVAEYLAQYADKFTLPVKSKIKVNQLSASNNHFDIESSAGIISADQIVISTGTQPVPYIPSFAGELSPDIFQLHSSEYINPDSLPQGDVLVVGAGTSGMEIALEISTIRRTFISGKPTFHIPDPILKYAGGIYWWFVNNIVTVKTPVGKKARKQIIHGGGPLIRISAKDLKDAGVDLLPRVSGVYNGFPQFEDGSVKMFSTVIWSTGYKPDFSWINMKITDQSGWPRAVRGISLTNKGLYFVGMPFQYGLTSGLIGGVGRDAAFISQQIH